MNHTLDLIIKNMALKEHLGLYSALLGEVYKNLELGNIELAQVLIEYTLNKQEVENGNRSK